MVENRKKSLGPETTILNEFEKRRDEARLLCAQTRAARMFFNRIHREIDERVQAIDAAWQECQDTIQKKRGLCFHSVLTAISSTIDEIHHAETSFLNLSAEQPPAILSENPDDITNGTRLGRDRLVIQGSRDDYSSIIQSMDDFRSEYACHIVTLLEGMSNLEGVDSGKQEKHFIRSKDYTDATLDWLASIARRANDRTELLRVVEQANKRAYLEVGEVLKASASEPVYS